MNNFEFKQNGNAYELTNGSVTLLTIPMADGACDTFEKIEDGAWKWTRKLSKATDNMRMEFDTARAPK